jgi:hypothetical protein
MVSVQCYSVNTLYSHTPQPCRCLARCNTFPVGEPTDTADNTLHCRLYHIGVAASDKAAGTDDTHCQHTTRNVCHSSPFASFAPLSALYLWRFYLSYSTFGASISPTLPLALLSLLLYLWRFYLSYSTFGASISPTLPLLTCGTTRAVTVSAALHANPSALPPWYHHHNNCRSDLVTPYHPKERDTNSSALPPETKDCHYSHIFFHFWQHSRSLITRTLHRNCAPALNSTIRWLYATPTASCTLKVRTPQQPTLRLLSTESLAC